MPVESVLDLVELIWQYRLVDESRIDVIRHELTGQFPDPRALARELVRRGWLTHHQVNQLFTGKGGELVLGSYLILERIGQGGVGQVFKGISRKTGKTVAIKVLNREKAQDEAAIKRFEREILAMSQLEHPNVVQALASGATGGNLYFVMEYVPGIDLGRLVKRDGALPLIKACDYIRQAALGLQQAFERGFIHRDVKPSNLLLCEETGQVKVLDLGLARAMDSSRKGSTALTQLGSTMGTPDFVSPEQARNSHAADERSDVYSLGCTLYFLLAGDVPFPEGNATEKLLKHHLDQPRPIEEIRLDVPPSLAQVLRRMMAKRPEDRQQTPAEVAADLERVLLELREIPPPPVPAGIPAGVILPQQTRDWPTLDPSLLAARAVLPPPELELVPTVSSVQPPLQQPRPARNWARPVLGLVLVGMVLAATALAFILARYDEPSPAPEPSTPTSTRTTSTRPSVTLPAPPTRSNEPAARPNPLDRLEASAVTEEERQLGAPAEAVAVLGSGRLRHWGPITALAYSADGKTLASAGQDRLIRLWDAESGRLLHTLQGHEKPPTILRFGPGERGFTSANTSEAITWDLKKKDSLTRIKIDGQATALGLSADAQVLVVGTRTGVLYLWTQQHDQLGLVAAEKRFLLHQGAVERIVLSTDGRWLASLGPNRRIYRLNLVNPRPEALDPRTLSPREIAWHARGDGFLVGFRDGLVLTFRLGEQQGTARLPPTGSPVSLLDSSRDDALAVTDGKTIAVYPPGKDTPAFRFTHPTKIQALTFSPDGKTFAFGDADGVIHLRETASGKQRLPLRGPLGPLHAAVFSPDGEKLALGGQDGQVRLYSLPLPGEPAISQVETGAVRALAFSPDGKFLASGHAGPGVQLWEMQRFPRHSPPLETERPTRALSFTPDGSKLLIAGPESVQLWSRVTLRRFSSLDSHGTLFRSLAFIKDETCAVADGKEIRWLTLAGSQEPLREGKSLLEPAILIAPQPKGDLLALAELRGKVSLYSLADSAMQSSFWVQGEPTALVFSRDGTILAVADRTGNVVCYDVKKQKERRRWQFPGAVQALSFADRRHLATANANGTAYILRVPD